MNLTAVTAPDLMLPRLAAGSREEAIRLAASRLAAAEGVPADVLADEILARERERETDLGLGVAIPHTRSEVMARTRLLVATLATPLPTRDPDQEPVDVMLLIAGPRREPRTLLQVLARTVRLLRRDGFLADLRAAATPADLWEAFRRHAGPAES